MESIAPSMPEKMPEINKKNSILKYIKIVNFTAQKNNSTYAQVDIKIEEFTNSLTLDQYCSEVVLKEIKEYSDYTIENSFACSQVTTAKLAQQPAYKIVYSGEQSGKKLKIMEVFTLKGKKKAYIMTYTAEENHFDEFLEDVENMINSFEFLQDAN